MDTKPNETILAVITRGVIEAGNLSPFGNGGTNMRYRLGFGLLGFQLREKERERWGVRLELSCNRAEEEPCYRLHGIGHKEAHFSSQNQAFACRRGAGEGPAKG